MVEIIYLLEWQESSCPRQKGSLESSLKTGTLEKTLHPGSSMACSLTLGEVWTARRSNQSILKEISPECSSEGLMLKLKLQYFGHLT